MTDKLKNATLDGLIHSYHKWNRPEPFHKGIVKETLIGRMLRQVRPERGNIVSAGRRWAGEGEKPSLPEPTDAEIEQMAAISYEGLRDIARALDEYYTIVASPARATVAVKRTAAEPFIAVNGTEFTDKKPPFSVPIHNYVKQPKVKAEVVAPMEAERRTMVAKEAEMEKMAKEVESIPVSVPLPIPKQVEEEEEEDDDTMEIYELKEAWAVLQAIPWRSQDKSDFIKLAPWVTATLKAGEPQPFPVHPVGSIRKGFFNEVWRLGYPGSILMEAIYTGEAVLPEDKAQVNEDAKEYAEGEMGGDNGNHWTTPQGKREREAFDEVIYSPRTTIGGTYMVEIVKRAAEFWADAEDKARYDPRYRWIVKRKNPAAWAEEESVINLREAVANMERHPIPPPLTYPAKERKSTREAREQEYRQKMNQADLDADLLPIIMPIYLRRQAEEDARFEAKNGYEPGAMAKYRAEEKAKQDARIKAMYARQPQYG